VKTLTRLGSAVSVETEDGRTISLSGSMLYDPSGEAWPRCSLLIMGFQRAGNPTDDVPKFTRKWFGDGYEFHEGRMTLPPKALTEWVEGPRLAGIVYERTGLREDADESYHPFGGFGGVLGRLVPIRFGRLPILYRRGSAARVELGNCALTPDGLISP
jgi:hypothetical protein